MMEVDPAPKQNIPEPEQKLIPKQKEDTTPEKKSPKKRSVDLTTTTTTATGNTNTSTLGRSRKKKAAPQPPVQIVPIIPPDPASEPEKPVSKKQKKIADISKEFLAFKVKVIIKNFMLKYISSGVDFINCSAPNSDL